MHFATYLNDHLAGAVAALELLDRAARKEFTMAMGRGRTASP